MRVLDVVYFHQVVRAHSPGRRSGRWGTVALVLEVQAGDEQALAELLAAHLKLLDNVIGRAVTGL